MPRTQLSKVQALVRGRKVRRDALRLAAATTKIQALIRGRKFRRPRTAAVVVHTVTVTERASELGAICVR